MDPSLQLIAVVILIIIVIALAINFLWPVKNFDWLAILSHSKTEITKDTG